MRIPRRRNGVVLGIVPVRAPFVNVLAHIKEAESIGGGSADRLGTPRPTRAIAGALADGLVAPRIEALLQSAARGAFPFGLGR